MMDEKSILKRKIYILLITGGAIVAATFVITWIYGYGTWEGWWIANFLHFVGGVYAFFFIRAVFLYAKPYHGIESTLFMEILLFICGAVVLGVLWEWFEFAIDRYRVLFLDEPSLMTYADNIGDLIIDTLGAVVAACFYIKKKRPI